VIQGSLHVAVATRSFRRYSTYTAATAAGIFANCVFGVINAFVLTAVWAKNPDAGGYDVHDAVTYVWLGQAMIMVVAIWGGGSPTDLATRIKTGDVAMDFYRPVGILGWYLAADVGRAAFHLLSRGLVPTLVGALLFDLTYPAGPAGWLAFGVSVSLALLVSFAIRFLVAMTAFWVLDDQGTQVLASTAAMFFSGLTVPLVLFPGWFGRLALALPWAAYIQAPADLWLGKHAGWGAVGILGLQLLWAVVLLGACALLLKVAERKVVVQGG
jgi:viologen exporter family transport system permease protein